MKQLRGLYAKRALLSEQTSYLCPIYFEFWKEIFLYLESSSIKT